MNSKLTKLRRGLVLATVFLAGCASTAGPSPTPIPLDLQAVTTALAGAGIAVVDVTEGVNPRDGAWRCLPGSFGFAHVSQQAPAAFARPGDRPSVDILLFPSDAQRAAAQATIDADGQVKAEGCGVVVDWVAKPHVLGARNVLLFIATDDPAALAAIQAAATRLKR